MAAQVEGDVGRGADGLGVRDGNVRAELEGDVAGHGGHRRAGAGKRVVDRGRARGVRDLGDRVVDDAESRRGLGLGVGVAGGTDGGRGHAVVARQFGQGDALRGRRAVRAQVLIGERVLAVLEQHAAAAYAGLRDDRRRVDVRVGEGLVRHMDPGALDGSLDDIEGADDDARVVALTQGEDLGGAFGDLDVVDAEVGVVPALLEPHVEDVAVVDTDSDGGLDLEAVVIDVARAVAGVAPHDKAPVACGEIDRLHLELKGELAAHVAGTALGGTVEHQVVGARVLDA